MAKIEDCPGFETFGSDVKAAREALNISRRALAENTEQRERVNHKLQLCPEKYLPIIEATIDGAIKLDE